MSLSFSNSIDIDICYGIISQEKGIESLSERWAKIVNDDGDIILWIKTALILKLK